MDNTEIGEFRVRSPECSLVYPPTSKCAMCENCYGLKRSTRAAKEQSHVQEEKEKNRKPETLMSREELIEKLHDEKKKRVNLERREKYRRIESEMKEFEESDHEDFVSLFTTVEKEELPEGMRLLWEAQADALQNKRPNRSPMASKVSLKYGMKISVNR